MYLSTEEDGIVLRSRTVVTRRPASYRLNVEQLESRELLSAPSTPLNDIGSGFYNGMQGGLYPNGCLLYTSPSPRD